MMKLKYLVLQDWMGSSKWFPPRLGKIDQVDLKKKHQLGSLHLVCIMGIMDWSSFPIFPPILSSSYELSMDECS